MDVRLDTEFGVFVWDAARNGLNRRKRGIAFEDAVRVFGDTWAVLTFDGGHSALEDRHILAGMVRGMWIVAAAPLSLARRPLHGCVA